MSVFDGSLYFTATPGTGSFANQSVWISDGTATGTRAIFTTTAGSLLYKLFATVNGPVAMGSDLVPGSSILAVDLYLIGTGDLPTQRIAQIPGFTQGGPTPAVLPDGKFFFSVAPPTLLAIRHQVE